eukprot:2033304-Pyramimonas_sp.AAC.1
MESSLVPRTCGTLSPGRPPPRHRWEPMGHCPIGVGTVAVPWRSYRSHMPMGPGRGGSVAVRVAPWP